MEAVGDKGSTWTIASQVCTIDLINDVLPTPKGRQYLAVRISALPYLCHQLSIP